LAPAAGSAEGVALPPLPAALREARAVAALYPGARLLEGTRASRDSFLAALRDSDVLHFAGHAEAAPDDPGASRLWLANASDSRRLSPLLASDLMRSGERGRGLVVLSGCETSLPTSRRRLGGDGYAGALLATGARAVIGTAWAIVDEQAESLFLAFHRHLLTGLDPAEALRRAQIERIRSASEHDRSPTNWAFARLSGV
ncbi:MAG: CHAT domain-containing protein, partial [Thermoanaerobaculia bacterium]|nr:CHAT domain-containing protein [Thermoanaerobaculia bacterium]